MLRPVTRRDSRHSATLAGPDVAPTTRDRSPRHDHTRLLRDPRRAAQRLRAGDQVRLSQAGAQVPSRPQPGRQGGRGAGSRRRRRPTASSATRRSASATTPTATPASGGSGRLRPHDLLGFRRHPRRLLRLRRRSSAAAAAARAAAPTCATTSSCRFEEAVFGTETHIQIPRAEPCATCQGSGAAPGTSPTTCSSCGGARPGHLPAGLLQRGAHLRALPRHAAASWPRPARTATARATSPSSASSRSRSRPASTPAASSASRGEGEAGSAGGPPGDLYVVVRVEEHAFFQRDGASLLCEVPDQLRRRPRWATSIEVPTLDGGQGQGRRSRRARRRGTTFRVRGQGVPHLGARGRGDLHVTVRVVVPDQAHRRAAHAARPARQDAARARDRAGARTVAPRSLEHSVARTMPRHDGALLVVFRAARPTTRTLCRGAALGAGHDRASRCSSGRRDGRALARLLRRRARPGRPAASTRCVRWRVAASPPPRSPRWTGSRASARASGRSTRGRSGSCPPGSARAPAPPSRAASSSSPAAPSAPAPTRPRGCAWPRSRSCAARGPLGRVVDVGTGTRHPVRGRRAPGRARRDRDRDRSRGGRARPRRHARAQRRPPSISFAATAARPLRPGALRPRAREPHRAAALRRARRSRRWRAAGGALVAVRPPASRTCPRVRAAYCGLGADRRARRRRMGGARGAERRMSAPRFHVARGRARARASRCPSTPPTTRARCCACAPGAAVRVFDGAGRGVRGDARER